MQHATWLTYTFNSPKLSSLRSFYTKSYFSTQSSKILRIFARSFSESFFRSFHFFKLSRQIVFFVAFFLPFSGHALTSQTTANQIQGSAPYLTFDGGSTRAVDTNGLLGITLSDGTQYTPSTNPSSSTTPIVLPAIGQSFADIGMLIPANTNSVTLSALIGPPYNYWGDDDGDSEVTATGNLSLSIIDNNNQAVSRNTVLTTCNNAAPYRVKLTNTDGILTTRYGVPNSRIFSASNVTYYINPKVSPVVCFAKPVLTYTLNDYSGPASIWNTYKGFLTQSTMPSSYSLNFPTTGAHGLYFDLEIENNNQTLSWAPVSRGGITATMTNSSSKSVHVTLTGPVATGTQWSSSTPGNVLKPSLPQTFELVGRDSNGNDVVKYGFVLKQWFVNRGTGFYKYSDLLSWCGNIGYHVPRVKDLTNAIRTDLVVPSATPSSPTNHYQRRIGAGFFTEWGSMDYYSGAAFSGAWYWTSDLVNSSDPFVVYGYNGGVSWESKDIEGLCVSEL